nr:isoform 2 of cysteine-rich receptor-like protein kinase 10 [Quercus suber]
MAAVDSASVTSCRSEFAEMRERRGGGAKRKARGKKKYNAVPYENASGEITTDSLQYDLATIEAATNNFADDNKQGSGGFGDVFKGTLPNKQEIAVKRLSQSSRQGKSRKSLLIIIAIVAPTVVVSILLLCIGYCFLSRRGKKKYNAVPYENASGEITTDSLQYDLATIEAATNNFADDNKQGSGGFGDVFKGTLPNKQEIAVKRLSQSSRQVDETHGNTSKIVGTFGYMSPEYAMHGQFSVKSDVYSFGVLILEILSGKKISAFSQSDTAEDLLSYAWKHWSNGSYLDVLDSDMRDSCSRNEVIQCIHIGLLCVQENPADRPSMATIILMLNSDSVTLPSPQKPPFFLHSRTEQNMSTIEVE